MSLDYSVYSPEATFSSIIFNLHPLVTLHHSSSRHVTRDFRRTVHAIFRCLNYLHLSNRGRSPGTPISSMTLMPINPRIRWLTKLHPVIQTCRHRVCRSAHFGKFTECFLWPMVVAQAPRVLTAIIRSLYLPHRVSKGIALPLIAHSIALSHTCCFYCLSF